MGVGVKGRNDRSRSETMGRIRMRQGGQENGKWLWVPLSLQVSGLAAVGVRKAREWEDCENGMRCEVQICVELRMLELIQWIGQVQRKSRAKLSVSKRHWGEEERGGGQQCGCLTIKLTGVLSPPGAMVRSWEKTGELSRRFDASVYLDDLSLLQIVIGQVEASSVR